MSGSWWRKNWWWVALIVIFVAGYALTVLITMLETAKNKPFDTEPLPGILVGTWYVMYQHGNFDDCSDVSIVEFPSSVQHGKIDYSCGMSVKSGARYVNGGGVDGEELTVAVSRIAEWFPLFYENMTAIYGRDSQNVSEPNLAVITGYYNLEKYIAILSDTPRKPAEAPFAYIDVSNTLKAGGLPQLFKDVSPLLPVSPVLPDLADGWTQSKFIVAESASIP